MPTRIRLRPRRDTLHVSRGRTVFACGSDGSIRPDRAREGLFVYQTRTLSRYRWCIDGEQPQLSEQSAVEQHSWLGYYFQAPPECKSANPLQETIELRISRVVGEGMHEDVDVTNHTQKSTSFTLTLEADADFAARDEVENGRRQKGELRKEWHRIGDGEWQWSFDYHAQHQYDQQGDRGIARLHRGLVLRLRCDSEPAKSDDSLSFRIQLNPHQTWKACLVWQPYVEGKPLPVEPCCNALVCSESEWNRKTKTFLAGATHIRTTEAGDFGADVGRVLERSRLDLAALRLFDLDEGSDNWKLAAGIPTYLALFGRDMLGAAWQASMLSLDMSRGALSLLAKTQTNETNDWRDAQPGRMLHQSDTDPLSELNFRPRSLYFGNFTSPVLFPIVASQLWHWCGDKAMVQPYIKPALNALAWADKYCLDDTGFYRYTTRSIQGVKNQAWKDSSDAIVYPDGSQVENPLGTCEMQAFAYAAKLHFSELLWWFGHAGEARRLHREAKELKERFNSFFWMEDVGYLAMAIDNHGQPVKSISSDPGHCTLSGIVEAEFVPRIVSRMMRPDLFSGWGVRTLSSEHPAFNPFAYHRGTVWPVENGSFVLAMARYGLHPEMWRLARALFEAATLFEYDRLPEVFGGHSRDQSHPFPGIYDRADSPQAWSASAPFLVLQALLGIYAYAPMNVLFLDPWLPDWLPQVTIEGLRVGQACVDLMFRRSEDGRTHYEVSELRGDLHILRQPSPWSITADWGERVKDAVASLLGTAG
ncbi:MAG TPA: glycogen debranching N-terminal domain-containing protein [Terriglobia bacterium]|nr:glycogen debranching N-terminal domain-containing protein [Terriglobia bacterium]